MTANFLTAVRTSFIALSTIVLAACATPSAQDSVDIRGSRTPWPAPAVGDLSPVEREGWRIYRHDQAAWKATDTLLHDGPGPEGVIGYITDEDGDESVIVRFLTRCKDRPCSLLDVRVQGDDALIANDLGPLTERQIASWRARQLAVESGYRQCSPNYNSVVFETEYRGEPAWRVYLLAASTQPDVLILAGHHRFLVDRDGRTMIENEALSNGCLSMRIEQEIAAPVVTHILHDTPIETHVFTSLDFRLPVYVATRTGDFKIEGARIEKLRDRVPDED